MTRFEYIAALREALSGLPEEVIARTVADYERRIVEASAAGQSEDEIIASLGDPHQVAAELAAKAAAQHQVAVQPRVITQSGGGGGNFGRFFFSLIGLAVFDFFLIVPAIVYSALLLAAFTVSIACYGGGIFVAVVSATGVSEFTLHNPHHNMNVSALSITPADQDKTDGQTSVNIGKSGIHIDAQPKATASASASSDGHAVVDIGPQGINIQANGNDGGKPGDSVNIDVTGIHVHGNGDDASFDYGDVPHAFSLDSAFLEQSRTAQVLEGCGLTLAGILAFLICLVITRYTALGLVRLAQMEYSVLKDAFKN